MACAEPPELERLQRRADQQCSEGTPSQVGVIEPGRTDRSGHVQHRRCKYECGPLESDD